MSAETYVEKLILDRFITDTLAAGYAITLEGVKRSIDHDQILNATRTTCDDVLIIEDVDGGPRKGWVHFVYGNGTDVISDCSDNEVTRFCLKGAEALVEEMEG